MAARVRERGLEAVRCAEFTNVEGTDADVVQGGRGALRRGDGGGCFCCRAGLDVVGVGVDCVAGGPGGGGSGEGAEGQEEADEEAE